jgi:anti-anti-sigma factor
MVCSIVRPEGCPEPGKLPMKVLKENLSGIVVLTLKGEFDSFVTNPFSNEIGKVQGEGVHKIVLNMRLVKFVNSTALGSMIKARKGCKAGGGDLVVSQPSPSVREAMESLGLDRLFSIYDDDESAITALDRTASVEMDGESESAVMIHIPSVSRPVVARLRKLEKDSMDCRAPGGNEQLVQGREVRLKFRLPLYRKEFFDVSARIERADPDGSSCQLSLHFTKVSSEDQEAIASFVEDMKELRNAARGSS